MLLIMTAEHRYVGLSLEICPNWWGQFLSNEIRDSVYFSNCLKDRLSMIAPVQKRLNSVKLWRRVLRDRSMLFSGSRCFNS